MSNFEQSNFELSNFELSKFGLIPGGGYPLRGKNPKVFILLRSIHYFVFVFGSGISGCETHFVCKINVNLGVRLRKLLKMLILLFPS